MSASDEGLELDAAQAEALAGFEREAGVFDELGAARADDAARIAAWVDGAAATAGGATAAAAASKAWIVGGVVAAVVGAAAIAAVASRPAAAPTIPVLAAPVVEPAAPEPVAIEPPAIAPPSIAAPAIAPTPAPAVGSPPPPAPTPRAAARPRDDAPPATTAADLLREANAARRDGDKPRALTLYRRIGREFADSRERAVAQVAIGRLELDLGHPETALAAFDAYLRDRSTGNLAEEAAFGRASALRALGRTGDERAALRDFLARYPDSVQVERARSRLDAIGP
ncbi:MAG: tetratricopeptide repeat protein [Nannocystaceae bacterium]|nr:tetratricopeptide repeat protein [Nannocystaceae bacterium]